MLEWLSANLVNIVVIAIIAAVVLLLIRSLIRDKRAGKGCGGSCASCGGCSSGTVPADDPNATYRVTVQVEGMMCGMCEAHVNDAVRKAVAVKKVSSSHVKGETVITVEGLPDIVGIQKAINGTGYQVKGIDVAKA